MLATGPAARLTIHLSGTALWHHKPVYAEIVHRARHYGLAGASVFHGFSGFDAHMPPQAQTDHASRLSLHGPCVVVIVDEEQRLREFLAGAHDVLTHAGMVALDHVTVYRAA